MDQERKRKRYKLYEIDSLIPIPSSTLYSRKKKGYVRDDEEENSYSNEATSEDDHEDDYDDDQECESENFDEDEQVLASEENAEKSNCENYKRKGRKNQCSYISTNPTNSLTATNTSDNPDRRMIREESSRALANSSPEKNSSDRRMISKESSRALANSSPEKNSSDRRIISEESSRIPANSSKEKNSSQEMSGRTSHDDFPDNESQISENNDLTLSDSDIENEINLSTHEDDEMDCIEEYFNESSTEDENEPDLTEDDISDSSCNLSKEESKLLHLALALRHNLPDIALQNMLELTDCHLTVSQYTSKYRLLKTLPYPDFEAVYYCNDCESIIKFENNTTVCEKCSNTYCIKELKSKGQYFIYIPLQKQLENFVQSKLYSHVRKIPAHVNDTVNGEIYRRMQNKVMEENDLTLNWNCDGVQVFKKSKRSMTPLQVMINELPYRLRRSNVFLVGLWMNDRKPIMQIFLDPFVKEMQKLSSDGFISTTLIHPEPIRIRVFAFICSVDSVARPQIQRMKQFNGKYGCSYCLEKGERVSVGSGSARVYCNLNFEVRTRKDHMKIIDSVLEKGICIKGVKGPTVTQKIPYLDIINGYPPDYMHACLLGVTKLFLCEWFDSGNYREPWYLGSKVEEFNDKLQKIKPPCEITRTPQPISEHYNANDYKTFAIYTSLPTLNNLLPKKYLRHWFLYVLALYTLLKNEISDEELGIAREALNKFVSNIESLYGKRFMKFNVHLLLHIPHFVKYFGALWAWSAFPFENFNGVIKKLFHNTQHVPEQVCKLYFRLKYVKNNADVFGHAGSSVMGRKLFTKLMRECRVHRCVEYGEHLRIFGRPKTRSLSLTEKILIEALLGEKVEDIANLYDRFIYKNILYHSTNYKRLIRRNNSCVITTSSQIIFISGIVRVDKIISRDVEYIILGRKLKILNETLIASENFHSQMISFIAEITPSTVCVQLDSIKNKCFCIELPENQIYVTPLVNTMETD